MLIALILKELSVINSKKIYDNIELEDRPGIIAFVNDEKL